MAKTLSGKSVPIAHMISQDHTSAFISFWLTTFKNDFGAAPKEIVVDDSKALAKSFITTFTSCTSTNNNKCNAVLNGDSTTLPEIYFRLDRSHITKNLLKVNSMKNADPRTKRFYCRIVGYLVQCQDFALAKIVIRDLFTCLLNPFNGGNDENMLPAETSMIRLTNLIKKHEVIEPEIEDDKAEYDEGDWKEEMVDNHDSDKINKSWLIEIVNSVVITKDTDDIKQVKRYSIYYNDEASK